MPKESNTIIRKTLDKELYEYYNDLEGICFTQCKGEVIEEKKIFFGKYIRKLYRLKDAYIVNGIKDDVFFYIYERAKRKEGKVESVVVCSPVIGGKMKYKDGKYKGKFPIAMLNAYLFRLMGFTTVVVCTNNKLIFEQDTPEKFELELKNVVYNNIQVIHYLRKFKHLSKKAYAIGVSLGALTVTIMAGICNYYKKAIIVLGGGPLAEIMRDSEEPRVKRYVDMICEKYKVTREEFCNRYKEEIKTDPLRLSKYIPNDTAYQIIAEKDVSVGTEYQYELNKKLKPKKVSIVKIGRYLSWVKILPKKIRNGHYLTFLVYPILLIKGVKFLRGRK